MKKIFKYTYIGLFGMCLLYIVSCKKNNLVVDKTVIAPAFAKFNTVSNSDTVATYYVKSTNDVYKLPIGITNVTNTDRTINFTYTSATAVQGTQFNAPASLVIKAGTALDTLVISGLFSGYPLSSRKDVVKISISGGDVPASAYKANYYLTLRKYCDVNLADFYGAYLNSIDNGNYGPYKTGVLPGSAVSTGSTTGSIIITNLWDYGIITKTKVNLDWTDPANFKASIPDQVYVASDGIWIKNSASAGSFSSCDQTFALKYTLYYKATGGGYASNQSTIIGR